MRPTRPVGRGAKAARQRHRLFRRESKCITDLALGAITHPEMFQDISVPLGWMNAQYEQRPGYIDLGDSEALRLTEAITMEGWFQSNSNYGLVNKGGAFLDDGYGFTLGDNIARFELQNTQTQEKTMADVTMQRNREWFHLAATWDIKSREIICYKDGIRQDQVGFFNGPIGVSDQHLNLGRIERRGNRYCSAGFSEFRIWDPCSERGGNPCGHEHAPQGRRTGPRRLLAV